MTVFNAYRRYHDAGCAWGNLLVGTAWLRACDELPEDWLDRLVADPRRPGAGDDV